MIPYIINTGLILCGCLAFYKLLLQRETFYKLNRYMLIICLAASFSVPLLPVPHQLSFRKAEPALVQNTQENIQPNVPATNEAVVNNPESKQVEQPAQQTTAATSGNTISMAQVMTWLTYLYWFGVIVFAMNFLAQVAMLTYRAYTRPVIKDGPFRIVEISGDRAPCSFGNNIFINPEKYDWDTYSQILQHEKVHIRQGHTMDILIAELVLIFQWFNPFAWLYRKEVESNLEFLTDDHMVQREAVEKSSYQMSLLKVSTPHFPLSLTTNYNQSLLKKRIAMMNAKKSNVHTAWKYFFLLPLLVLFAALLNEPTAYALPAGGGDAIAKTGDREFKTGWSDIETEGVWFAVIKDDKISFHFKRDGDFDNQSFNGTTFLLSEFPNLPKGQSGTFSLTREAGTMNFTGKFEGNEGMGRYKFAADESYAKHMNSQGIKLNDRDQMTFFFVDVEKSFLQMLKDQGYTDLGKNELIPLAALKVDQPFIRSVRSKFKDVSAHDLVTFKALGITDAYITEIQNAGYKNISAQQIVTFKAQGIDKDYLSKVKKASTKKNNDEEELSANDVVSLKALDITDEYINSFKAVGFDTLTANEVVPMKALGITPEFVKSLHDLGFKNLTPHEVLPFKSQNITAEYINSFKQVGYNSISARDIVPLKALNITPEYIKTFQDAGYKDIHLSEFLGLKAQGITPDDFKQFEALGMKNISVGTVNAARALGVTPAYIKEMKAKGFDYNNLDKYVQLRSITN
ncbi:MAG TPA: M56 family metallopeptidase [Chitinophagaceae bacterium]